MKKRRDSSMLHRGFNRENVNTRKTHKGSLLLTSVLILTLSFIFIIPTISAVGDLNGEVNIFDI
jgi:hypothetical protein